MQGPRACAECYQGPGQQHGESNAGCGTGLVFLNNIAQLVDALGGGGSPSVYVSVFSVSSCAGRLLLGYAHTALHSAHAIS